jgi:hypothetical protein
MEIAFYRGHMCSVTASPVTCEVPALRPVPVILYLPTFLLDKLATWTSELLPSNIPASFAVLLVVWSVGYPLNVYELNDDSAVLYPVHVLLLHTESSCKENSTASLSA